MSNPFYLKRISHFTLIVLHCSLAKPLKLKLLHKHGKPTAFSYNHKLNLPFYIHVPLFIHFISSLVYALLFDEEFIMNTILCRYILYNIEKKSFRSSFRKKVIYYKFLYYRYYFHIVFIKNLLEIFFQTKHFFTEFISFDAIIIQSLCKLIFLLAILQFASHY